LVFLVGRLIAFVSIDPHISISDPGPNESSLGVQDDDLAFSITSLAGFFLPVEIGIGDPSVTIAAGH
jgi:hypothetical protein